MATAKYTYEKAKGAKGISKHDSGVKDSLSSMKKGREFDPAGYMDSRPSNDDRRQSAK